MLPGKRSQRRSEDTMDEDSDDKDTKRKSRNLSEKKRRDQFNLLVNELSSMVATGGRKMDKSTVLKATISFLRNHNEISMRSRVHEIQEDWKPSFLTNEEFTHLVLEAVDGFIVVFSTSGQIFYVSESITSLLGHLPNALLSSTIFDLVWDEEHNNLYNNLFNPAEEKGQVCFSCHIRRGRKNSKEDSFELVHFVGYVRSDTDGVHEVNFSSSFTTETDTTRLVFVGIGRVQAPQLIREMSIVDSNKNEFTSRHSLEWKFLFLDHRAPPIIGYLPFELLGTSGYDYYHVDDLEKVVSCHEALMQKGEGMSCYYRFLTKGQQWIWLQTRFYITYHQWNSKPEFIVCTHRVISYVDVLKYNRKERDVEMAFGKNSPTVSAASSSASATWGSKSTKRRYSQEEQPSDCTSMSADSPTSRLPGSLQQQQQHQSMKPSSVQGKPSGSASDCSVEYKTLVERQSKSTISTFVQPIQSAEYVSSNVTVQPAMENFSSSTVLSHIPPVEMSPAQSQLQADLQRKHAELQALIGQQQAELRRVSEQLLMARLGLLPVQDSTSDLHPQLINSNIVSHCQYGPGSASSVGVAHVPMLHTQQQMTISCSSSSASSQQSHHGSIPPPPPPPPSLPTQVGQAHLQVHSHHHQLHRQQQQQQPVHAVQPSMESVTTRFHNRNVVPPPSQSAVVTGLALSSIPISSDDVSLAVSSDNDLVRTYPPPDSNSSTISK